LLLFWHKRSTFLAAVARLDNQQMEVLSLLSVDKQLFDSSGPTPADCQATVFQLQGLNGLFVGLGVS
jgi:hypothetical protein